MNEAGLDQTWCDHHWVGHGGTVGLHHWRPRSWTINSRDHYWRRRNRKRRWGYLRFLCSWKCNNWRSKSGAARSTNNWRGHGWSLHLISHRRCRFRVLRRWWEFLWNRDRKFAFSLAIKQHICSCEGCKRRVAFQDRTIGTQPCLISFDTLTKDVIELLTKLSSYFLQTSPIPSLWMINRR